MVRFDSPARSPLSFGRKPIVLVVDDDRGIREMFAGALRIEGFDVRLAVDGITALKQVEHVRPDVVVLDLDLPFVSGIAIHEELNLDPRTKDIPVVIVTGTDWSSPFPVTAVLHKPIAPDALIEVVNEATAGK